MSGSLKLLILGVAIILVVMIYKNLDTDSFVGRVPMQSMGYGGTIPGLVPGVYPHGQPMMYAQQMYPSKYPYYDDSVKQMGKMCNEPNDCGVLGACQGGVCKVKTKENTVFDITL
jgi:hypothetical protein